MLQAYQITVTLIFLGVLVWAIHSRSPFNLGAIIGGFMLFGFDWLWCSRGFWNATTASGLIMIPGLDIQGVRYPISICFVWAIGFGFLPLYAARFHDRIGLALGRWHIPIILTAAAIIDMLVEIPCVSGLGVWTYHQAPNYLFMGVVWSNAWFLGGALAASYFGLARVEKWAAIPVNAGFSLTSEATWKGAFLAAGTILVPAFLLGTAQLFWWSATQPWIEAGRPF